MKIASKGEVIMWLGALSLVAGCAPQPFRPELPQPTPERIQELMADARAPERAPAQADCVTLRVTNCYGRSVAAAMGPVTLCADVRITPRRDNRWLRVTWDYEQPAGFETDPMSPLDSRSGATGGSLRELAGEHEPSLHQVKMRGLSGGTYLVTATVYTNPDGTRRCGQAVSRVKIGG